MLKRKLARTAAALFALYGALPLLADTQYRIQRMTRDDVPIGKGQCDIRLQVDNEVEVTVRRDMIFARTIAGRDVRDDGSECNAPLPDRGIADFGFDVRDKRNDIVLLAEPNRGNNYSAIVRIRDTSGGEGRYHFRLTWQMTGSDTRESQRPGRPGMDRRPNPFPDDDRRNGRQGFPGNNTLRFDGRGRGSAVHNRYGSQRLSDVSVDMDRAGRLTVRFRGAEAAQSLTFTGNVTGRQGRRYEANVVSEDRRMRGPMVITLGGRDDVETITFDGVDGRDRLRLNWEGR